jgi:hypothetical protein
MGEPTRLGTTAAQPATGPTTSRIDAATAARAAARMGTTTGPAATNATAVGRTTSAAAPPRPPLVPEGADHHPAGGSRPGVPARPGGVGRQATDSTRQHRCSLGGLDDHRPTHDGGSHHHCPDNDDPTDDGAASNDPPADDGPSGCTDAPADHIRSPASNHGRTVAVRSAGQPIRLQLLRAWRAYLQSGVRRLRLLRLHPQLRQRDWLHGGVPRRHVQHVRRSAGCLFLS